VQIAINRQIPAGIEKNTMMRIVAKLSEEPPDEEVSEF
jgi:hypothetical protein